MSLSSWPLHEPVIVILLIDEPFRSAHGLSPDAVLAVTELYEGTAYVLCTDCDTTHGVVAAGRAYAEATGAAFQGAVA